MMQASHHTVYGFECCQSVAGRGPRANRGLVKHRQHSALTDLLNQPVQQPFAYFDNYSDDDEDTDEYDDELSSPDTGSQESWSQKTSSSSESPSPSMPIDIPYKSRRPYWCMPPAAPGPKPLPTHAMAQPQVKHGGLQVHKQTSS